MNSTDNATTSTQEAMHNRITLPWGLIGFPAFSEAEVVYAEEEWPFLRLRQCSPDGGTFLVVRPGSVVPEYAPSIADEDMLALGAGNPDEIELLNIATIHETVPRQVTLNLVGPILVNRNNGLARQVVIENFADYSARHCFFREEDA